MSRPLAVALLLSLTLAGHVRTLGFDFVYEDLNDFGRIVQAETGRHLMELGQKPLRSLTTWTLDADRELFGIQPVAFHLGNLIWHVVNVLLVFAILARVGDVPTAVFLASIFAVHPLLTEAVSYVSARSDLVSTTGVLLALWAASAGSVTGAVVGVVLAVLAKETAIVAWGLVPLWAYWTRRPFPVVKWSAVGLFAAACVWGWTRLPVTFEAHASGETLISGLWLLSRIVVPFQLSIEPDVSAFYGWIGPALVLAVGLTVCALYRAVWRPWWALGWLWTVIVLSPRLLVPTYEGLHERHFYIVLVGWCLGVGYDLSQRRAERDLVWV